MSESFPAAGIAAIVLSVYILIIALILYIRYLTKADCCDNCCGSRCCVNFHPIDATLVCLGECCDCRLPTAQTCADTICPTQDQCTECLTSCIPDTNCDNCSCLCFEIRLTNN